MVNKKYDGRFIIDRCKSLVNMARNEQWENFEKDLRERDVAIKSVFKNRDVKKLTVSENNDLETIKRLNDDIKSIVLEKQKIIQDSLLVDTQRNKAHQAYQQQ